MKYTCSILSEVTLTANDFFRSGTQTWLENFQECLRRTCFDSLRDREDFQELLDKVSINIQNQQVINK